MGAISLRLASENRHLGNRWCLGRARTYPTCFMRSFRVSSLLMVSSDRDCLMRSLSSSALLADGFLRLTSCCSNMLSGNVNMVSSSRSLSVLSQ